MDAMERRRTVPHLVLGAGLVGAGALLLLHNFELAPAGAILATWWPVILVAYGVARIWACWDSHFAVSGALLALAGGWLLLSNLGYAPGSAWQLWPLVLVLIGLRIARGRYDCRCCGVAKEEVRS
ncbi:MAG: hypothetical protein KBD01_03245 [Acidobacteria bacterium]|nr:hypothetical protein [Acidobacteriota bacterium]